MPLYSAHVLKELLDWVGNVYVRKKDFTVDIKFSKMPVENLGDTRSYALLYFQYAYMYVYVTAHVCYLWYYV